MRGHDLRFGTANASFVVCGVGFPAVCASGEFTLGPGAIPELMVGAARDALAGGSASGLRMAVPLTALTFAYGRICF